MLVKNLLNRAKYVLNGEDAASNIEIIIWISVVLMIATALYAFKGAIIGFITNASNHVNALNTQ